MAAGQARHQCDATVVSNAALQGDYFRMVLKAPAIARDAQPGQFVHVRIPAMPHRMLRRPFSICDADTATGEVSVVYKIVGEGTQAMARLAAGSTLDALGPLGVGYDAPSAQDGEALLVAGGYGCAAMFLLAKQCPGGCRCLFGGRTAQDILMLEEFERLGCRVRVSTNDGSAGHRGVVTDLLEDELRGCGDRRPPIYACGPNPMLEAVAAIVGARAMDAQVSLDPVMCCGVGACFACVVRKKADNEEGWEYVRTCLDGPVFRASEICWDVTENRSSTHE